MGTRNSTISQVGAGAILCTLGMLAACKSRPPPDPQIDLVARGREIFFNETFNGNGRTCGTCHREENNFTIDPNFIATLPPDDPLFVAEFNPELQKGFENPKLLREFGLILENMDGFEDLQNKFVMRGVPHTLALRTSVNTPQGPRTGWSGDGAPGDGTIRSFAVGAVIQHFTKTLKRIPDVDFRLPTSAELDALEAFQLSLGRQQDLNLPLRLKGTVAKRGQAIFLDNSLGKCNLCHVNAGANAPNRGNANFNTGVENLPDQPADLTGELVPPDDGLGRRGEGGVGQPGDGTFNTPPLVEAADTGPFFHNNSIETIEGAVDFYNSSAFSNSPSGRFLASTDPNGIAIRLEPTQVVAVAAFLRVLNALNDIQETIKLVEASARKKSSPRPERLLRLALAETDDSIMVLSGGGLHPKAVGHLQEARSFIQSAMKDSYRSKHADDAVRELRKARDELVE